MFGCFLLVSLLYLCCEHNEISLSPSNQSNYTLTLWFMLASCQGTVVISSTECLIRTVLFFFFFQRILSLDK